MMGRADELDDLFSPAEAARRRAERAAMMEQAAERERVEAEAERIRKQRAREFAIETSRRSLLAEYQRYGVEPLSLDGDGKPAVSLSMLLSLGWTIAEVSGKRVLVKPEVEVRPPMQEREQS